MELSDFSNDEIRTLKSVMSTYGEKMVDLSDLPTYDAEEKETILQFLAELVVLPTALRDGRYTGDDLVSYIASVSAAAFSPVGKHPESEISLITYSLHVAQMAYDLGVHDAASGTLSTECQQRVTAEVEEMYEKSRKLSEFHDWLKDL